VFAELKGVRLPPRAVPCGVKALVVWGTCCPKPHFGIAPKITMTIEQSGGSSQSNE